jgi:16S rRNA processing protein RimM
VGIDLVEVKPHTDGLVAQIDGVNDRNSAEALKGVRIYLPRSAFPATPEGEYYWVDLIGLDVVNREGVPLGVVRDLMATGPNSVLVLEYTDTIDGVEQVAERMIPFVAAYIDNVDKATRRITADWQTDY